MCEYFADIDWTQTWSVVLVGLVVVFAVLIILVLICWAMGKVFSAVSGGNGDSGRTEKKAAPAPVVPAVKTGTVSPVVEDGISDEIVAAISAAVACMMEPGKSFALKSVRRAREARSAWSAAGIAENTRPF